jgi:hypothetical protein
MTLVNAQLEVLQIDSLNKSIIFIKCKSEKQLIIKFHLVLIVKSLDILLDKSHNIGHQALSCVNGEIP